MGLKLLTVAVAALVGGGFSASPKLAPAASFVAGKQVTVGCATSQYEWLQYLQSVGLTGRDTDGATVVGSGEVRFSPTLCQNLRLQLAGKPVRLVALGPSIEVLTQEAIHARGVADEGVADCDAVHEMPRVAVRFFHVKPGAQLRALMAATWQWRQTGPAAYRTVC